MSEETPAPKPQPVPHPAPKPVQAAPAHATPTDSAAAAEAARWGRVDDDGKVWLRSSEGERIVGQYAASGSAEDALAIYVRRYLDLETQVSLLEARVETVNPDETQKSLKALAKDLKEPAAVGDIEALQQRVEALKERVAQRREALSEERKVAKQQALEHRTRIVERAEEISRQDPEQTHWRNSRTELSELFDEWRQAQRSEARFDRPTEQELWKRFSAARSAFDKNRRHHFTDLDQKRAEVTATKEKLIERAAELASSTDWGPTGAAYRELLEEWKRAGRTNHRQDDKLWHRFREAQQPFYDAREAHFNQVDAVETENLGAKLEILKEAEAVLPIDDVEQARAKLREIGERWDAIGPVPRADVARTEGRMREIEDQVRGAEAEKWRKSDPEKERRSQGMAAQLEHLIDELDEEIKQAQAAGEDAKVKELTEALQARQAWLDQVNKDL